MEWGKFVGALMIFCAGSPALAQSKLKLKLNGVEPGREIAIPDVEQDFKRNLVFVSTQTAAIDGARLRLRPFVDRRLNEIVTGYKLDGAALPASISIKPQGEHVLEVSATLPRSGTYTTTIALIARGHRLEWRLRLERGTTPSPIEVRGMGPTRAVIGLLSDDTLARWNASITETGGLPAKLGQPVVLEASLKGSGDAKHTIAATLTTPDKTPPILQPQQSQNFKIAIGPFADAGEYEGVVRWSVEAARPLDVSFRVFVKQSPWMAFLLILLGLILSAFIREYSGNTQKRLIAEERLLRAKDSLQRRLVSQEDDTALARGAELATHLEAAIASARSTAAHREEAALILWEQKVDLFFAWAHARQQSNKLSAAKRAELKVDLDAAIATITKQAATAEELKAAGDKLRTLATAIPAAHRAELEAALQTFQAEVAKADIDAADRAEINLVLDQASKAVKEDRAAAAAALQEKARLLFVQALIEALENFLAAAPKPTEIDDAPWAELKRRTTANLALAKNATAEEALRTYRREYAAFVRELIDVLLADIAKRPPLAAELEPARLELVKLSGTDLSADPAASYQAYSQLRTKVFAIVKDHAAQKLNKAITFTENLSLPAGVAEIPEVLGKLIGQLEVPAPRSADSIARHRRRWDLIFHGSILVIAAISGLKILYADDLTWGGLGDYAAAFLWGLGLHQVSGLAFEGLNTFRTKLVA